MDIVHHPLALTYNSEKQDAITIHICIPHNNAYYADMYIHIHYAASLRIFSANASAARGAPI